ncbi:hypothetical protein O181_025362 [Austropuccinia psidii MF-1]|uniref:DUF21-domain-containing protein n=1 Tax=Austropuccinia psidii MF-1 TaxID=1389203 RepID=A0A9Q3CL10_9BASI|nr:hypothetical protein [Austropuccinia psidii MF-1]
MSTNLIQPRRPAGLTQSVLKLVLLASSAFPLRGKPIGSSRPHHHLTHQAKPSFFHAFSDSRVSLLSDIQYGSAQFWWMMGVIIFLVLLGGCFAGLTLGLMGLDILNLRVLSTSGSVTEQVQAKKVLKLLERGRHWVLVVLLLSNVVVNETLPIFLDSVLGGGAAAILISTALIVIFGEIIPQSVCVRYGLAIGAKSAPFVLALMYLEFPIAYPIALLLDYILGHDEGITYRKAELKTFVGLHRHIGTDGLNEDEVTIISAVLDLSEKTIVDIMTPIEDTFTLAEDSILDEATVTELVSQGYSRVPIHEAGNNRNFIGMLLVKRLISYDPEDAKPVKDFQLSILPEGSPDMTCLEALNFFQQGRSHMLLVSSEPGRSGGALGVVSLEDVIEEMIGEEIIDETDQYVDVAHKIKVIRKPIGSKTSIKGLAPLIKGVMEKRRLTSEFCDAPSESGEAAEANFGESADIRNGLINNLSTSSQTPRVSTENSTLRRFGTFDKVKLKGAENTFRASEAEAKRRNPAAKLSSDLRQQTIDERLEFQNHHSNVNEDTPLLDHQSDGIKSPNIA